MAAIDFPASPTLNQLFSAGNGVTYKWNGTVWIVSATGGASITVSDTPPGSPSAGALWWNSVLGQMFLYYQDPNTSQWVPATVAGPTGAAGGVLSGNYPNPAFIVGVGEPLVLYSEQVLAATTANIVVTIPVGTRSVELQFGLQSAGASNDTPNLNVMQGGTPYAGSTHDTQFGLSSGSTATASQSLSQPAWLIGGGIYHSGFWKCSTLNQAGAFNTGQMLGTGVVCEIQTAGVRAVRAVATMGGPTTSTSVTGFRIAATNSFAAGSYIRCLVLP